MTTDTKVTHTPGPWTVQASSQVPIVRKILMPHGEAATYRSTVFNEPTRAFVCRLDFGYGKSADEANARLIAAAPRLIDALRGMVGLVQLVERDRPDLTKSHRYIEALDAIAAAEGSDASR